MPGPYDRLAGRVALISGAGRGIGRALALGFAAEGADLVLCSRTAAELNEVRARVEGMGRNCLTATVDVTSETEVDGLVDAAIAGFGRIDILVNNAGATIVAPSADLPTDDWRRVVDLNQTAVFTMTRRVAREMIARRRGAILNIASLTTFVAFPERLAYASTKAAIGAMTRVWAVEWAKAGVRVNALAPGMVATALQERLAREGKFDVSAVEARIPLGYRATPEDLVGAATFLVSDEAAYVTGVILPVDGGFLANGFWHATP